MFKNCDLLKIFIKRTLIIFLLFFGIFCVINYFIDYVNPDNNPRIETEDYTIIGQKTQNGEYFMGIPYAEDTLLEPLRIKKLSGIINAINGKNACFTRYEPKVDRYCPYLNIYRCMIEKKKAWNKLLDVIVYVGTAFKPARDSDFYPAEIINTYACQGAIVVNINYRQIPLGYFVTGNKIKGNTALYDVKAGLEWVKSNIKYFGGDLNKITIIGAGNGAVISSLLSRIPETSGLFNKLVLMQGSSYSPYLIHKLEDGIESSRLLSAKMNCSDSTTWPPRKSPVDDNPIIACLQSKKIHDIVVISQTISPTNFYPWPFVIDENLLKSDIFELPEAPIQNIPTFILSCGFKFFDGSFTKNHMTRTLLNQIGELISPLFKEVKDYYTRHLTNDLNGISVLPHWKIRENFVARVRENFINFGPSLMEAQSISSNGAQTYFLRITNNDDHLIGSNCLGKGLFDLLPEENQQSSSKNKYEKTIADLIINFIKNRQPSQKNQNFKWHKYDPGNPQIIVMDKKRFYTKKLTQVETAGLWLCKIGGSRNMSRPAFCFT